MVWKPARKKSLAKVDTLLRDENSDIKYNTLARWKSLLVALDSNLPRGWTPWPQIPCPPGRGLGARLITTTCKKKTSWLQKLLQTLTMLAPPRVGAEVTIENENATKGRHAKQRMTFNKLMPLFLPKSVTKVAQRNVGTMYETGRWAQIAKEIRKYSIDVRGISGARWKWKDNT